MREDTQDQPRVEDTPDGRRATDFCGLDAAFTDCVLAGTELAICWWVGGRTLGAAMVDVDRAAGGADREAAVAAVAPLLDDRDVNLLTKGAQELDEAFREDAASGGRGAALTEV